MNVELSSFILTLRCWDISAGNLKWIYQVPILAAIVVRKMYFLITLKCNSKYNELTLYFCLRR